MTLLKRAREINRGYRGTPILLAVDALVFLTLIVLYLADRARAPHWPRPFHFPSGLMTISMIMFLGAASFVMVIAERFQTRGDFLMAQRMIALVFVGWFCFLFLLAIEWARLFIGEHVSLMTNPWNLPALGLVYYGLTAYQATHIVAGTVWIGVASQSLARYPLRNVAPFVHFTTGLFVIVAFFVILSSMDLAGF